jgi:serine/threonine protein kinase
MNLRHPCITAVIGVLLRSRLQSLGIVRLHLGGFSLRTVISTSPEWWTPTATVKAVVGLVYGLRFAHSLGLFHGYLTEDKVIINEDGMIQITDFGLTGFGELEGNHGPEADVGGFSGESWTPKADVRAFATIVSEIVVGRSGEHRSRVSTIPSFVFEMIERGQSADLIAVETFSEILKLLKDNQFKIMKGTDLEDITTFVHWIESSEPLIE